jgi:hypothetical protein
MCCTRTLKPYVGKWPAGFINDLPRARSLSVIGTVTSTHSQIGLTGNVASTAAAMGDANMIATVQIETCELTIAAVRAIGYGLPR